MVCLILSQDHDLHAEQVQDSIVRAGHEAIIFKRYNLDSFISYEFHKSDLRAIVLVNGKKYDLSKDISSIYSRMKPAIKSEIVGENSSVEERFRQHEWLHVLQPLEDFIAPTTCCINPFYLNFKYYRKPSQLKLALDCNLNIPKTVISNSSERILSVLEDSQLIYKTLHAFMSINTVIYTNKISRDEIEKSSDSIASAPGIFQELIEKKHELRITIVDDKCFVVKVNSQNQNITKLDWRRDQREYIFSQGQLSPDTTKKLFNFHKKTGLIYACYDFIVDRNENEIFLECNPNGQWLFVGDELGQPITESIVKKLIN